MPAPKSAVVARAVKLHKEKRAAEDKLAKVKAQIAEVEPQVLAWFAENGIEKMRVSGVTVSPRRELWASMADSIDFLRDALDAAGIDPTTIIAEKANTQTLSALVREYDRRGEPLPNSLAAAVNVSETFKVSYRAA